MTLTANSPDPLKPFESIGLCFSGGGYRATAFSLGVLDYLDRVDFNNKPLLENVIAISSVSGGTITAAFFAVSNGRGDSFETFYTKLYAFLKEDKLLDEATGKFMDTKFWRSTTRSRSVINGFALTYYEKLVSESFDALKPENLKGHLKYMCFNATEFTYGLAFRFQNVNRFGNYQLSCDELQAVRGDIRIADAIASSSCFPVGFDPMVFPNDYLENHEGQEYLDLINQPNFSKGVGVMDGGIVDNQGIGSMVNFDKSSQEGFPLDLLIVNDVDGFVMPIWEPYQGAGTKGGKESFSSYLARGLGYLQLKPIYWIGLLVGILGLMTACILSVFYGKTWSVLYSVSSGLIGGFALLTGLGLLGDSIVKKVKREVQAKIQAIIPHAVLDDVEKFAQLEVSQIKKMIINRWTSAMLMINEIFLRQIRRLNFDLLYKSSRFIDRRITSTVYQLNGMQNTLSVAKQKEIAEVITITKRIMDSALIASKMPTTLWWDAEDLKVRRQDNLIACGQFTTCYNLIKYIQNLPDEYHRDEVNRLEQALLEDWKKFEEDPLVFVSK
ncbi:patatin-like phospholipase family protein [Algoriphagus persicinus]|uniref:patatin-like phospholipase family protein n=1 Tax=Algoriphagus persicinus TaxID=3108754 RepID=UPI002B3AE632|nr:patatin-like phospholipase family protein [Algoriphagus sp. E1-3-M2]MEB2784694.1 patatin-like phospholipase family protein [Algoriphagus sp. E1-3-M2]